MSRKSHKISSGQRKRLSVAVALGMLAFLPPPAAARLPADAAVRRVLHASDSLFFAGRLDSAAAICRDVVARARVANDRNVLLESRLRQAAGWILGDRLAPGEAAARECLALAEALDDSANVRRSLRWLGFSLLKQSRLAEASAYYQRLLPLAVQSHDFLSEGLARGSLAYRDLLSGRLSDAESGYRMACACLESAHDIRSKLWNLVGLARVQVALGEYASARSSYQTIEREAAAIGALVPRADAINNFGTLEYNIGDPARAQEYWRRAIALYREAGVEEPRLSTEINLCIADQELGHVDDAGAQLARIAKECAAGGFRAEEASALNELADLRLSQGRPAEATALCRRILDQVRPEVAKWISLAQLDLARATAAGGQPQRALDDLMRAMSSLRGHLAIEDRLPLELQIARLELKCDRVLGARSSFARTANEAAAAGLRVQQLEALVGQAECERAIGHRTIALVLLREAQRLWESERRIPSDPEWRVQRGQLAEQLCFDLAELMMSEPAGGDSTTRLRAAYDLLQRFKARTLLEHMSGPAGASTMGAASEPLTLAQVQTRVLRPRELLLDAFVGEHDALLFAVTRDSVRLVRLPDASAIGEKVRMLREFVAATDRGAPAAALALDTAVRARGTREVSRELLSAVSDLIGESRRVIVSADGPLIALPFESLPVVLTPGAPESALVAVREVTRVPSISLLAAIRSRPASDIHRPLLASVGVDSGEALHAALKETRWIARRYRDVEVRASGLRTGQSLSGNELARYDVLHFAAHARVDDQRPWNSAVLIDSRDSSGAHGYLTASIIAATRLNARLAVLAGCESAGGRVVWGEGVEGLSAAFLTAGVPALVATLWPVDDAASAQFTHAFYAALERGHNVAAALHDARLTLSSGPDAADAAAFVLIGDGDVRVRLNRRAPDLLPPIVLSILAIAGLALSRRVRRSRTGQGERAL